jgi:hypothetical protein
MQTVTRDIRKAKRWVSVSPSEIRRHKRAAHKRRRQAERIAHRTQEWGEITAWVDVQPFSAKDID